MVDKNFQYVGKGNFGDSIGKLLYLKSEKPKWIAYLERNMFSVKENYNSMHAYVFKKDEVLMAFHKGLIKTCMLNPTQYIHILSTEDSDRLVSGQVIEIKYSNGSWRGKIWMANQKQEIVLTAEWVQFNFELYY